ncbi:MAG: hypothetical protein D6734_01180 [Candidatus Schekmanbacteria bacterium]|nr:MAG: hypothetical protein D6734_01180 [Candidatus Schekmanbacteria bacterium]
MIEEKILTLSNERGNLGRFYKKGTLTEGSVGREDYYLGYIIVSEANKKYPIKKLIEMDADEILRFYFSKKAGGS